MSNKSDSGQKRNRHISEFDIVVPFNIPLPNNNNVVEGDASRIPSEPSDTTSNAPKSPTRSPVRKKIVRNMAGLIKIKGRRRSSKSISRHKKGNQKNSNYDFATVRESMSNPQANAQEIAAHIAPAEQREPAPPKLTRKQMKSLLKIKDRRINVLTQENNKLMIKVERCMKRIKTLKNEKRDLATVIKEHKRASKDMMDSIQEQSNSAIAEVEKLVVEAKVKQAEAESLLEREQSNSKFELRRERSFAHEAKSMAKHKMDTPLAVLVATVSYISTPLASNVITDGTSN